MQPTFFNIAATVYLCMGFVKLMLLSVNLPTAFATMLRLRAKTEGCAPMPSFMLALMLVTFTTFFAFLMWPLALRKEKFSFFAFYTQRMVMKDLTRVYHRKHQD